MGPFTEIERPKKSLGGVRKNSMSDRRRSNAFSLGGSDQGPLLDPEYLKNLEDETKKPDVPETSNSKLAPPPTKSILPKKPAENPKPNTPKAKPLTKTLLKVKEATKKAEKVEKIEQANKALYESKAQAAEKNLQGKFYFNKNNKN